MPKQQRIARDIICANNRDYCRRLGLATSSRGIGIQQLSLIGISFFRAPAGPRWGRRSAVQLLTAKFAVAGRRFPRPVAEVHPKMRDGYKPPRRAQHVLKLLKLIRERRSICRPYCSAWRLEHGDNHAILQRGRHDRGSRAAWFHFARLVRGKEGQ